MKMLYVSVLAAFFGLQIHAYDNDESSNGGAEDKFDGSCDELDLSDSDIQKHVQNKWLELYNAVVTNGFTISQLENAAKVVQQVVPGALQRKTKTLFLARVTDTLMLRTGESDIAKLFRKRIKQGLINIDQSLKDILGESDEILTLEQIQKALEKVEARHEEVKMLMKIDLAAGMVEEIKLDFTHHKKRLKNALLLFQNNDDAQRERKKALAELQLLVEKNKNLIESKCRVWQVLR